MQEQQTLQSWLQCWFQRFLSFEHKAGMGLTEEERLSLEEEKQLFFNEIGVDEDSLKDMLTHYMAFVLRDALASTDEERQSIEEEKSLYFMAVENYKTAVDKHVREKNQKSVAPSA